MAILEVKVASCPLTGGYGVSKEFRTPNAHANFGEVEVMSESLKTMLIFIHLHDSPAQPVRLMMLAIAKKFTAN